MTFRQALALFEHWNSSPPENELLALFARVYTSWKPRGLPMTEEEQRIAHQKSLEERWKSGAMNAKQLFESMGGAQALTLNSQGVLVPTTGIESFPGVH